MLVSLVRSLACPGIHGTWEPLLIKRTEQYSASDGRPTVSALMENEGGSFTLGKSGTWFPRAENRFFFKAKTYLSTENLLWLRWLQWLSKVGVLGRLARLGGFHVEFALLKE